MKIIDAIRESISNNRLFFGIEFFPPHMEAGRLKLYDCMERLFQCDPLFCGVTWGEGGSTAKETIEICDTSQRLAPVLMQVHVTGAGVTERQMLQWLDEVKRRDLQNLFLLRGMQLPRVVSRSRQPHHRRCQFCHHHNHQHSNNNSNINPSNNANNKIDSSSTSHIHQQHEPHHHDHHDHHHSHDHHEEAGVDSAEHDDETIRHPFDHAVDLVRFVRRHFGDHFGITVAGYPEGHSPDTEDRATAIRHLKEKVDAGADLVICQAVFDAKTFFQFCEDCRNAGVTCPIVPSLMPVHSASQLKRMMNLRRLAGMDKLEEMIKSKVASLDDDEAVRAVVVDFMASLAKQFYRAGVRGVYFMTQNVDSVTRKIIGQIAELSHHYHQSMTTSPAATAGGFSLSASSPSTMMAAGAAFATGSGAALVQPATAASPTVSASFGGVDRPLPWKASLRRSESARPIYWSSRPSSYLAALEGIARFDDHPNGRWSSANSPAFGGDSQYHHVSELVNATAKLCTVFLKVRTIHDVAACFVDFLNGKGSLPWSCAEGLMPESNALITDVLLPMNRRGLLTINSQPAVNGVPSEDPMHGWGPKGGFVYQKEYLEFFCCPAMLDKVTSVLDGFPSIVYMAQTRERRGRRSNMPNAAAWIAAAGGSTSTSYSVTPTSSQQAVFPGGVNSNNNNNNSNSNPSSGGNNNNAHLHAAVTWGVFPSQDICQPTFVSSTAFDMWTPEAFTMWLYPFYGTTRNGTGTTQQEIPAVIQDIVDTWYLVTALDNDYTSQPTPCNQAVVRLQEILPEL